MQVEVSITDIKQRKADSQGRVAIGPQYADESVWIVVVEGTGQ